METQWINGIFIIGLILTLTSCGTDSPTTEDTGTGKKNESGESATESAPEQQQQFKNAELKIPLLGLQVKVQEGFQVAKEEGLTIILKKSDGQIMLLAYDFNMSRQNASNALSQSLALSEQATLQPMAQPEEAKGIFKQSYQLSGGNGVAKAAVHTRASEEEGVGAFSILVLGSDEQKVAASMEQTSSSVSLTPMKRNQQAEATIGLGTYSPGNGGYSNGDSSGSYVSSDKTTLTLCDGQFNYYSKHESFVSVPGAGGASSTEEQSLRGQYRIYGTGNAVMMLVYDADKGEFHYFPLQVSGNTLVIDGRNYQLINQGC